MRDLALERLERRGRLDLARERVDARVVEAQPVERARVELARGRLDVGRVRGEHVAARRSRAARPPPPQRRGDGVVARARAAAASGARAPRARSARESPLYFVYSLSASGHPRSASREAEGTGPMTPRQPAPSGKVPNPASPRLEGCRANGKEESPLPATALRCRICETEHALEAIGVCSRCFGPLDPVYDRDELARTVTPRGDRGRPAVALALRAAPARRAARRAAARARADAARRGAPARRGGRRRRALPQARHGQPDALVQGPRRRRRGREGAGARA